MPGVSLSVTCGTYPTNIGKLVTLMQHYSNAYEMCVMYNLRHFRHVLIENYFAIHHWQSVLFLCYFANRRAILEPHVTVHGTRPIRHLK